MGRDRYVLAFSSDHGVVTLPEQTFPQPAGGRGAGGGGVTGRVTAATVANAVEAALKIRAHTILDPEKAREGVEAAKKLYVEKGYLDAKIAYTTEMVAIVNALRRTVGPTA